MKPNRDQRQLDGGYGNTVVSAEALRNIPPGVAVAIGAGSYAGGSSAQLEQAHALLERAGTENERLRGLLREAADLIEAGQHFTALGTNTCHSRQHQEPPPLWPCTDEQLRLRIEEALNG